MEQKGKVYVNPNFKRNHPTQHGRMYVNPLFPKHLPNIHQLNNISTTRIHVNPNFIRPNIAINSVQTQHKVSNENNPMQHMYFVNQDSIKLTSAFETSKIRNTLHQNQSRYSFVRPNSSVINENKSIQVQKDVDQKPCTSLSSNQLPPKPSITVTKSKYSFVRPSQNQDNKDIPKESTMIKINKYKSVAIQNVRKNLESKNPKRHTTRLKLSLSTTPSTFKNKYKYVNTNISLKTKSLKSQSNSSIKSVNQKLSVSLYKKTNVFKNKINKKQFKINNIPCPLFRKFGKCIRNERDTCDFLHDKNHVSICRKYLSGSCHDSNCLLSHDISLKKMPTCSFYLHGMCTKQNCPYLHVKLNKRTKICAEFLKGFCEKGDNCLYRHENMCPNFADKGVCFNKQCQYPHKSAKNKLNKSTKSKTIKPKLSRKSNGNQAGNKRKSRGKQNDDASNVAENRYYANIDNTETSEVIKPMRTALGDLPSYIQL